MEAQVVLLRELAPRTGDAKQVFHGLRATNLDEVDVARRPWKIVKNAKDESPETVNLDGLSQRMIDVTKKGQPRRRDSSRHKADTRPSGR